MPGRKSIFDAVEAFDMNRDFPIEKERKKKLIAFYHLNLTDIPDERIYNGINRLKERETDKVPSVGEFRALCSPVKRPELRLLTFEESKRDNELNKKNSNSILEKLGVDLSNNGKFEVKR